MNDHYVFGSAADRPLIAGFAYFLGLICYDVTVLAMLQLGTIFGISYLRFKSIARTHENATAPALFTCDLVAPARSLGYKSDLGTIGPCCCQDADSPCICRSRRLAVFGAGHLQQSHRSGYLGQVQPQCQRHSSFHKVGVQGF